jgi:predicted nucleic acid-binding protein
MKRAFVDTSAWFAYVNRRDPDHQAIRQVLRPFAGRLVTTSYIFNETITICGNRLGHGTAAKVGELLRDDSVVDLVRVTAQDEETAWELYLDRADKAYSFTDCTSFVIMRRLGIHQSVSLDEDFRHEGFETLPPD